MARTLRAFERLAYRLASTAKQLPMLPSRQVLLLPPSDTENRDHPFEERNVHPMLPVVVKSLFDNGHYSQSTFEAFKYIDKVVQSVSGSSEIGKRLMMQALSETTPSVVIADLGTESGRNEQEGYKFLFAGGVLAIRNPRGHEHSVVDSPELCLDHLGLASMLLRRLEEHGLRWNC